MEKLFFELHVTKFLFYGDALLHYLKIFESNSIDFIKYGSVEKTENEYKIIYWKEMLKILTEEDSLFIKAKKNNFLHAIKYHGKGLVALNFYFNVNVNNKKQITSILNLIFSICENFNILFGFGCSRNEFDHKHKVTTVFPNGLSKWGHKGVSIKNFYEYISGIYWVTILGNILVEFFQNDKILSLPECEKKLTKDGQFIIILNGGPFYEFEKRDAQANKIVNQLGSEYFWNKDKGGGVPVPPFLATLLSLDVS